MKLRFLAVVFLILGLIILAFSFFQTFAFVTISVNNVDLMDVVGAFFVILGLWLFVRKKSSEGTNQSKEFT
jgi:uncharacterized membrane protein